MPLYLKDKMVSGVSLGVPGKSAYEAAKEGGYVGTEEEFNQALTSVPGHITDTENPHSVTAAQVGADVAGAADEALNSAKAYTDQAVAGVIPGENSKESPADSDSIFIYDNADSGKPKKTLISKLVELFNNTFYSKTETDTLLQDKADTASVYTKGETYTKTETNTLLQNKAPAGYGLGEKQGKRLLATDDLNSITTPGWYWWSVMPSNAPINNACMLVYSAYSGDCYVQEVRVYLPSGYAWWECGAVITRQIYTTYIGEWEWVNPPMLPNEEYRTTERYLGKPVYAKARTYAFESSYDSASQFELEIPHEISNFGSIVRAEAVSPPYMIPYVFKNGGFAGVRAVNATNILFDSYKTSWSSGNKITFKLFYTKS